MPDIVRGAWLFMLIWLLSDSDSSKHLAFSEELARFCSYFPDVKAEFAVKTRSSLWKSFFAHLRDPRRNPLADVVEIPHNWTALLAKLGLLCDLSTVLEDFNPLACPEFITRGFAPADSGAVFSAPWWMDATALFCSAAALSGAGVKTGEAGLSWEEFERALEKLRGAPESYPLCFPASSGALELANVLPRIRSRGGGLFSGDYNRAAFNKDETLAGVRDFTTLALKGYFRLFPSSVFDGSPGRCAFAISPRDIRSGFVPGPGAPSKKPAPVMLPFPGCSFSSGGDAGPVNVRNLAISSGADGVKEPAALLKWLLKPERSGSFAGAFGAFPCQRSAFESRLEKSARGEIYRKIFARARLRPNTTVYPTAEILLEKILWNVSLAVARENYSAEYLSRELIIAQGEADYLLSLY